MGRFGPKPPDEFSNNPIEFADAWYYFAPETGQLGPFTLQELQKRLTTIADPRLLVWRDGMKDWQKASDIPQLNAIRVGPPPLPAFAPDVRSISTKGVSADAHAMMLFEANKKSMPVSYLLWFFFGGFGGHRFYNGRSGSAVAQLLLTMCGGVLLAAYGLGVVLLVPVGLWVLVDAFLIPGWIRKQNSLLATQLGSN